MTTRSCLRYRSIGRRMRDGYADVLARSGERTLGPDDLMRVGGIWVTTPLRTALDLGRLLRRDQALAGLDAMLRLERLQS